MLNNWTEIEEHESCVFVVSRNGNPTDNNSNTKMWQQTQPNATRILHLYTIFVDFLLLSISLCATRLALTLKMHKSDEKRVKYLSKLCALTGFNSHGYGNYGACDYIWVHHLKLLKWFTFYN